MTNDQRTRQECSQLRTQVEHVFKANRNEGTGPAICSVRPAQERMQVGLQNLDYNLRRLVFVERSGAAPAA